jgi:hypothetical protein
MVMDKICARLLEYYAALGSNSVPTFGDKLSIPSSKVKDFFTREYGIDRFSRNVGTELPLNAV